MNDRELLELAAKAAGIIGEWVERYGSGEYYYQGNAEGVLYELPGGGWSVWNPLEDDGDALRLAVTLNMGISIPVWKDNRIDVITFRDSMVNVIEKGNDAMAATRRAIVRAAAAIAPKPVKGVQA